MEVFLQERNFHIWKSSNWFLVVRYCFIIRNIKILAGNINCKKSFIKKYLNIKKCSWSEWTFLNLQMIFEFDLQLWLFFLLDYLIGQVQNQLHWYLINIVEFFCFLICPFALQYRVLRLLFLLSIFALHPIKTSQLQDDGQKIIFLI